MSKPETRAILFRLLIVLPFSLGLMACSGGSGDCDSASGDCAPVGAGIAADTISFDTDSGNINTSGASAVGNNVAGSDTEIAQCSSLTSDSDGDGYGFEDGASCIVPVASPDSATTSGATTNGATTSRANSDRVVTVADITHIAVVTGQSNVEASETSFNAELDQPHPRAFAYTDSGWQIADLHQVWDDHAHPGNHSLTDPSRSPNNNFTFHYAKTLAQLDPNAVVAFIVLAAPGEGIANWDFETPFYLKMRGKITEALGQIPHRDSIDAMLWHQGESDWQFEGTSDREQIESLDPNSYEFKNYYPIRLRNVIANFRTESWARGDLPFICGETRIAEGVNRHLTALNSDDDPNSACVAATDLPPLLSDLSGVHFSAAGLRELGRRYAQQFLSINNR